MKKSTLTTFGFILLIAEFFAPNIGAAATFFFSPSSFETGIGGKVIVNLKINSEEASLNAAQTIIHFPPGNLEVSSVDKEGSIFNFWLEDPSFSNTEGTISLAGGTPNGVSGGSLQVLKITFTAKGSGSGTISLTDAAIAASDGSGTNILSKLIDSAFTVTTVRETAPIAKPATEPVPAPTQIVRAAVPSGKLPIKPVITVPLFPDETRWYNLVGPFVANWKLPEDVTDVSTAVNKQPNFAPTKSEGLFDNKTFPAPDDGAWYLHLRFKNNIGWGPTAHYRLAIDTAPPLAFETTALEGVATDNPTPTLQFETSDALSGLKGYQIYTEDNGFIVIPISGFKNSFVLPLQSPGKKRIVVKAMDFSGNSVESIVELDITPIPSPILTFVTKQLFSDENRGLTARGTAIVGTKLFLKLYFGDELVSEKTPSVDALGNWELVFDEPLRNGKYKIVAQSQDLRGALSLEVNSGFITVQERPIIQLGPLQLGRGGASILLLLILIFGFSGGIWFYKRRQKKLSLRVSFTASEISKIFQLIGEDVKSVQKALETPTTADDQYSLTKLRENLKKMEVYLKKGLEKINK